MNESEPALRAHEGETCRAYMEWATPEILLHQCRPWHARLLAWIGLTARLLNSYLTFNAGVPYHFGRIPPSVLATLRRIQNHYWAPLPLP